MEEQITIHIEHIGDDSFGRKVYRNLAKAHGMPDSFFKDVDCIGHTMQMHRCYSFNGEPEYPIDSKVRFIIEEPTKKR